ncbi:MAG: prepilin peptidase [Alphaproteobacteria bacterium]|jgi:prepilin signal peptidase PulO-like enzyme (type II secretory pathway)|nr:prepilin peptidase [Alphaproteobacteria bacterium]
MLAIFIVLLLVAVFCAVMMSIYDWKHQIIPDMYLLPFMLIGLLIVIFFPWFFGIAESIIAGVIGYSLGMVMRVLFKRKSSDAIGLGDIKLMTAGGIWLGISGLAISLVISCILGGIWGFVKKQKFIPFAPFFFIGAICSLIVIKFLI